MTKDWSIVQDEITDLSFNKGIQLKEVRELMERKYQFTASTRAYRMKLKEWGILRRKRMLSPKDNTQKAPVTQFADTSEQESNSVTPVRISPNETPPSGNDDVLHRPMNIDAGPVPRINEGTCQSYAGIDPNPERTVMGLLSLNQNLQPTVDPWSQARTRASEIVLDMLAAILAGDARGLEKLLVENDNHVNDPVGLPFDVPTSRFSGHPALDQMVIMQHPDQTLLDIACGMPCGPVIWALLSYGAKGSRHPLGTDLALHNAIKNGRPYTVQALLAPGRSNVNGIPGTAWKPILQAVFWNVPDIVKILLTRGANPNEVGPSPYETGLFTQQHYSAIQLCLKYRDANYSDTKAKERCHQILAMLIDHGASTDPSTTGSGTSSLLEMFIKPWKSLPFWSAGVTTVELQCFEKILRSCTTLQVEFDGFPCQTPHRRTFEHQALWHTTPQISELIISSFERKLTNDGMSLLHELLGSCPAAKRHPADTLRDIKVLMKKGVIPDFPDALGNRPLSKCISSSPPEDMLARVEALLEGGADAEREDINGVAPYVLAARILQEPLLTDVMKVLVKSMKGHSMVHVDGIPHMWSEKHFPMIGTKSCAEIMSYTSNDGDFVKEMQVMVPADSQPAFHRAYITIQSDKYFEAMTELAKSGVDMKAEKVEVIMLFLMRKELGLPQYHFDQDLIIRLANLHEFPAAVMVRNDDRDGSETPRPEDVDMDSDTSTVRPSPRDRDCSTRKPFQFNPEGGPEPASLSPRPTSTWEEEMCGWPDTTQVRWLSPCKLPTPSDRKKAKEAVLIFKCSVCANGTLLTKKELAKHDVEHAHTEGCHDVECRRRFCAK